MSADKSQALRDDELGAPRHSELRTARPRLRVVGSGADDTVLRRERFEAAHPEIAITSPRTHASMWTAHRDGEIVASQYQLGALLDTLDWLLAELP
jgi:hypothetical protein